MKHLLTCLLAAGTGYTAAVGYGLYAVVGAFMLCALVNRILTERER